MSATVELPILVGGLTGLTCDIFPDGSDSADVINVACTESAHRTGLYTLAATGLSGLKYLSVKNGGQLIAAGWAYLANSGTVQMEDSRSAVITQASGIKSNVKRNQALSNFVFLVTDSTNHQPITGQASNLTASRSLDGGAFTAGSLGSISEVGSGMYAVSFAAGDMNAVCVVLRVVGSGCDDTIERIITEP